MKTSSFERSFLKALKQYVHTKHLGLSVKEDVGNAIQHFGPAPDVSVRSLNSNKVLLIEVKGGSSSNTVPFASISKLKSLREFYGADAKIYLISSAAVPAEMRRLLEEEDIKFAQVANAEDAITRIEPILSEIETWR